MRKPYLIVFLAVLLPSYAFAGFWNDVADNLKNSVIERLTGSNKKSDQEQQPGNEASQPSQNGAVIEEVSSEQTTGETKKSNGNSRLQGRTDSSATIEDVAQSEESQTSVASSNAVDNADKVITTTSSSDKKAIIKAVNCDPSRCKPKVLKITKGYAIVLGKCILKDCDDQYYYLKKTKKGWLLVETGTGIEPDDLIKDGFPSAIAEELTNVRFNKK